MKLSLMPFKLENKTPFKIAHGERRFTETLFVCVEKDGIIGIGEASHVPYYNIEVADSIKMIESKWAEIAKVWGLDHATFWNKVNDIFEDNHFAKCAVDIAYYDWKAKKGKKPLWDYLGLRNSNLPSSCFTIGMKDLKLMLEEIKSSDFPSFKIKLGGENDLKTIQDINKITKKPIKADVNGGWSLEEALEISNEMDKENLTFIEQPLSDESLLQNSILRAKLKTPIFADESCFTIQDLEECSHHFDGINIKLTKCGGVYPALKMVERARELNLKLMLGCMTESSVGISTIAHLSSLFDYMDMDGSTLLKFDPALGVVLEKGLPRFNNRYGHGAVLKN
jgi:L-alanine-DL-glutamate epimerase-like enolase superfamily enzyme